MNTYQHLPLLQQICLGTIGVLELTFFIYLLVSVCLLHLRRRYCLLTFTLTFTTYILVQSLSDMGRFFFFDPPLPLSPLAHWIRELPWLAVALFLLLLFCCGAALFYHLQRSKKNTLTPNSIKESLDALPDGVCFATTDGIPLLINVTMNRLCGVLFDCELLNAQHFWTDLTELPQRETNGVLLRTQPILTIQIPDGTIWGFQRSRLPLTDFQVWELVAYDLTEQYQLHQELNQRNIRLNAVNERLRQFSRDVEQVTREQEVLAAKRRLHDQIGRSLLVLRTYLAQPPAERKPTALLYLWQYVVSVMQSAPSQTEESDEWEKVLHAAKTVQVKLTRTGPFPQEQPVKILLLTALRECLSNTVKHAKGHHLHLSVHERDSRWIAKLSNDGLPPQGPIEESGGLKTLRHMVEHVGGYMTTEHTPRFLLWLDLPRGVNEE